MFRALFISLFISLILVKPVAQFGWEMWYAINIEYVAEELCENQEEPELECNGKCYLMKQLAKTEAESQDQPTPEKPVNPYKVKEEQPFEPIQFCCQKIVLKRTITSPIDSYKAPLSNAVLNQFFHPPQLLS